MEWTKNVQYVVKKFIFSSKHRIFCSKKCRLIKRKNETTEWRKLHPNWDTKYRRNNSSKVKLARLKWKINNFSKDKLCKKEWKLKNPNYDKIYNQKNRIKINALKRKLNKTLYYRIRNALRERIYSALKNNKKSIKTAELLGCSILEFKKYLKSQFKLGMTWKNYGKWHIDHIKPCILFDLSQAEEQKKCFHYSNLQPLWAKENRSKGKRYKDVFKVGVPCSKLSSYISIHNPLIATTESEAVGMAAGSYLVGKKSEVFLQNSGLGNIINIWTSLIIPYRIKIKLFISIRHKPEHHQFCGKITKKLLKLIRCKDFKFIEEEK